MKTLVITKDLSSKLLKLQREVEKKHVLVGIPATTAPRTEPDGGTSPLSNAEIGYLMETGVPEKNIPARPFLVPGVRAAESNIASILKSGLKKQIDKAMQGGDPSLDEAMNKVGLVAASAVQNKITDGPFDPLAESTLARRKARGRSGDNPLIDTGSLRRSITYVIESGGKRKK